jgi:hypothetical protein
LQPKTLRLIKLIAKNTAVLLGWMAVGAAYVEVMVLADPRIGLAITVGALLAFIGYVVYYVSKEQLTTQLLNEKRIADRLSRED